MVGISIIGNLLTGATNGIKVQGAAAGSVLFAGANSRLNALAPSSTDGWVLTFDTATSAPKWAAPSGGGAIADNSVTMAKLQQISTATILGRTTTATGNVEILTPSQARSVMGLGTAATANTGTASGEIPLLTTGGVLPTSMIPALRSHEFVSVANQAARLALTTAQVQPGDECMQTDTGENYKLIAADPSQLASWVLISDISPAASSLVGTVPIGNLPTGVNLLSVATLTASGPVAANSINYINAATQVIATLPATAPVGSQIRIRSINSGGVRVGQNAGQSITYLTTDPLTTTLGVTGYIENLGGASANTARIWIDLECSVANTTWVAISSSAVDVV